MSRKLQAAFLWTGDSRRGRTEGRAKARRHDATEPYSPGVETHGLNPGVVKVVAEAPAAIPVHVLKKVADKKG